jgi:hypothetical protein
LRPESLAESDICPLRRDPKIPLDRTCRSPVWNPKMPAGSNDSVRSRRSPKAPLSSGGCNPTHAEPKLLASRTSHPLLPTSEDLDARELLRPCPATREPWLSRRAHRPAPPKPKLWLCEAGHPFPREARRPRLEPDGPSAPARGPKTSFGTGQRSPLQGRSPFEPSTSARPAGAETPSGRTNG